MPKIERVVLGVDLSERSLEIARWTARQVPAACDLILVYVVEPPPLSIFYRGVLPTRDKMVQEALEPARERLAEFVAALDDERAKAEARVGRPAECIAEVADEADADVIVIGKHGRHSGAWGGLGSTAEELFHFAGRPVLLLHDLPRSIETILMPIADSSLIPSVLGWAKFLADTYAARVVAFHALSQVLHGHLRLISSKEKTQQVEASASKAAIEYIKDMLRESGFDMARTTVDVSRGHADQEILEALDRHGADIIVMGSHGPGELERAVIGSCASTIARQATCPVLVVSEPKTG